MKHTYLFLISFFFLPNIYSQQSDYLRASRSALNSALYPFYHGVAAGDPLADRVIIWTRITLDPVVDPVMVNWEIATDTTFSSIVNSGSVFTFTERGIEELG